MQFNDDKPERPVAGQPHRALPLVPLVPVAAAACCLLIPISPHDFWGPAVVGRGILESGSIPATNLYSAVLPATTPHVYQWWLSGVVFHAVLQFGGVAGAQLLRAAVVGGAFALLARVTVCRAGPGASWRMVLPPLLLALLLTANNLELRPQVFSYLCFAALLLWLTSPHADTFSPLRTIPLGALFVLWANLHGAFVVGLLLLTIRAVAAGNQLPVFKTRLATLAVALAATLINPYGYHLYPALRNLGTHPFLRTHAIEWAPPNMREAAGVLLLLSLLVTAGMFLESWRSGGRWPWRLDESLTAVALAAAAVISARAVVWWGFLVAPLVAACLAALPRREPAKTASEGVVALSRAGWITLLPAFAILLPLLPVVKPSLPFPPPYRAGFAPPRKGEPGLLLDRTTPVEAVALMTAAPPRRVWTHPAYAFYVRWMMPQVETGFDTRLELFPPAAWQHYLKLSQGPAHAGEQLRCAGYDAVLIDRVEQAGLVQRLAQDANWRQIGVTGPAALFKARAP